MPADLVDVSNASLTVNSRLPFLLFGRPLGILVASENHILALDARTTRYGDGMFKNWSQGLTKKRVNAFAIYFSLFLIAWLLTDLALGRTGPLWGLGLGVAVVIALGAIWVALINATPQVAVEAAAGPADNVRPALDPLSLPLPSAVNPPAARAFASVDDAVRHGWSFENPVGRLGAAVVHRFARFEEACFEFSGLMEESSFLPEHVRRFGRLTYTRAA